MKKILSMILSLSLLFSVTGCSNSSKGPSSIELKENVTFSLVDCLEVKNEESNSVFYYFLSEIKNNSDSNYKMDTLSYSITDNNDKTINAIDAYQMSPNDELAPNESTFLYGYIGFPNNDQEDIGLSFKKQKSFISFHSIDVRKVNNKQIKKANKKGKFTLFEDDTFKIEIDGSDIQTSFTNGNTQLSNLKITYTNKTKSDIVIPYLKPTATINGININNYINKDEIAAKDLEGIKSFDFSKDGMAPKTSLIRAEATGYALYYLEKEQSLTCDLGFVFEHTAPDYTKKSDNDFVIELNSQSFGTTVKFNVPVA